MASLTGDVDIRAGAEYVLAVIADVESYPEWSAVHRRTSVDERDPSGRPARVTMTVSAMGMLDEQVLAYRWGEHGVQWTLVSSHQQRDQRGGYTLRPGRGGLTHVHYELEITPAIPVPGLIVRQVMRSAVVAATEGLRRRAEAPVEDG